LKKYLFILFLFCTFSITAQTYTYSYTDPCTGVLKSLSVPINGSIAVSYYGETSTFTGNDFQNGTFENWANQVLAQYQNISPCAQIVGVTTAVNVSQSTVLNTIGILNSLSALADIAGTTNILGGATTTVAGGTNNNTNNKQNKNGNNSNNNSSGNVSASGSNGTSTTNPNPSTNPSGTTSTSTTSPSGSTQQINGTSSTGSGENGGTTSSPGNEGGTSGGSQTTTPGGTTSNPSSESTSGSSSSTTTGTTSEGSTETGTTSSTEGSSQSGTTGNGSGGQGEQTETQEVQIPKEEGGQTNITGGSTTTIRGSTTTSGSSKSKEGGKPSVVASSDFVGFNFQDSEVTSGLKVTGGYTSLRWDGKRSWGVLADYTSALKGPNVTGFYALLKPKVVTILSGTLTMGFEGTGSLYGTLSGGQMFSFKKVKSLKVIYMATVSYGAVFRTSFLGTAVIAGGMYDLRVGKRLDIKFTDLMVYTPYVSYYNDLVMKSPYVMLPSIGVNIGITKKFKFNINAGGAWSLGQSTLNYTVTCGTRLMVGQD
jgi:hypothetical protein